MQPSMLVPCDASHTSLLSCSCPFASRRGSTCSLCAAIAGSVTGLDHALRQQDMGFQGAAGFGSTGRHSILAVDSACWLACEGTNSELRPVIACETAFSSKCAGVHRAGFYLACLCCTGLGNLTWSLVGCFKAQPKRLCCKHSGVIATCASRQPPGYMQHKQC